MSQVLSMLQDYQRPLFVLWCLVVEFLRMFQQILSQALRTLQRMWHQIKVYLACRHISLHRCYSKAILPTLFTIATSSGISLERVSTHQSGLHHSTEIPVSSLKSGAATLASALHSRSVGTREESITVLLSSYALSENSSHVALGQNPRRKRNCSFFNPIVTNSEHFKLSVLQQKRISRVFDATLFNCIDCKNFIFRNGPVFHYPTLLNIFIWIVEIFHEFFFTPDHVCCVFSVTITFNLHVEKFAHCWNRVFLPTLVDFVRIGTIVHTLFKKKSWTVK